MLRHQYINESIIHSCLKLIIEPERYGDGILMGLDDNENTLSKLIEIGTSPGDMEAVEALCLLNAFSEQYTEFPYVQGKNFDQCIDLLESKAKRWNLMDNTIKQFILNELYVATYSSNYWYNVDKFRPLIFKDFKNPWEIYGEWKFNLNKIRLFPV